MTPMTEVEWLACADARRMLDFLHLRVSSRKLRLLACAGWRRAALCFSCARANIDSMQAIEAAECLADDSGNEACQQQSQQAAIRGMEFARTGRVVDSAMRMVAIQIAQVAVWAAQPDPVRSVVEARASGVWSMPEMPPVIREVMGMMGIPFQPNASILFPLSLRQLAQSTYHGDGNHLILADALEESGHLELADHFRGEAWHPKGCWALDLILSKDR
jgi:hypothetical protein